MAKRRRTGFKRFARRAGRGFKRYARQYARTGGSSNAIQPDAMAYGALVQLTAKPLNELTNKIPGASVLGGFKDNFVRGLIDWLAAKNLRGFPQKVAMKGLVSENVMVGAEAAAMIVGNSGSVSSAGVTVL